MQQAIISICFSLISAGVLVFCSFRPLQILQLSSYQTGGYKRFFSRTKYDLLIRYFGLTFFAFVSTFTYALAVRNQIASYFGFSFYIILSILFAHIQQKTHQKTPLKFTARIIRLLTTLSLLYALLSFIAIYFTLHRMPEYVLVTALPILIPAIVLLANLINLPIEKAIARHYKCKAKKALKKNPALIKIGITGSFGKTTAKNILKTLLSAKYKVLSSPHSYNTPMGLCKLINAGVEGYDVLIAEMGARHTGDIKELCDMIMPDYGIITATGNQHLETFKTIDNIIKTKLELAACALKLTVLNSDDEPLINSSKNINKEYLFAGANGKDCSFSDVRVSSEGTSFEMNLGGKKASITTSLLGRHIPPLLCQCATLAQHLGVDIEQIIAKAKTIEHIPHRLQLIKTENGAVIDDAYNSNPEGARNALEILGMFEGEKVVISPGFVELGAKEKSENLELGKQIALKADYLFAVKNPDIFGGALSGGMPHDKIFNALSLDDAMNLLNGLNLTKPIILFLNDLPDNY